MGKMALWKTKYRYSLEKKVKIGKEAQVKLDSLMEVPSVIISKDDNGHVAILMPSDLDS